MKVRIGPYKNWFGPYQVADALCFWVPKKRDEYGCECHPDWVHKFGGFLAYGFDEKPDPFGRIEVNQTWLYKFLSWVDSKKKRTVKIHIDSYDAWSMSDTLAMIILPMLKILKEKKHGAPLTDDKDVPKKLQSTNAPPKKNEWDTDGNHFKRWNWVLDEMIWTFEQLNDDNNDAQFHSGKNDYYLGLPNEKGNRQILEGPNHTWKYDVKAHEKHNKRIQNGLMLFGKYYRNLWD